MSRHFLLGSFMLRRIKNLKLPRNRIVDARPIVTLKSPFPKKLLSSSALIATTAIGSISWQQLYKEPKQTPEEKAKIKLCEELRRYLNVPGDLAPEDIPDLMAKDYLAYFDKKYFIAFCQKQLKLLVETYEVPLQEAFTLLMEYNVDQHNALEHLHPSDIAELNVFELEALLKTKEYGVKATDIRYTKSISCRTTQAVFIILIEEYSMSPQEALAEVKDLAVNSSAYDSLNQHILNAIGEGLRRQDIFLLLNGKSIAEVNSDPHLKLLFKTKLNFVMEHKHHHALFRLLQPLKEFTPLQQNVLQELYWHSNIPYELGVPMIQTLSQHDLIMFDTRKYRRSAYEKVNVTGDLLHDQDVWFNSYDHVKALDVLVKKQWFAIDDAIKTLKSIQNTRQIQCIAKGATIKESAAMNEEQQKCFLELNTLNFSYGLSPEYQLTAPLALTIKTKTMQDKNHSSWNGGSSHENLKKLISERIPIVDSIKLINFMDNSAHQSFDNYSKAVIHLCKPRHPEIRHYHFIKREEVKREWTEETRNMFHPGAIISALAVDPIYDFSNSNNPYIVSELAFHVMGLGRDFFEKTSDEKPIMNDEFMEKFNKVQETLRKQFPEIATFVESLEKSGNIFNPQHKKETLLKSIEDKFGKTIIVKPDFQQKEEPLEESVGFRIYKR